MSGDLRDAEFSFGSFANFKFEGDKSPDLPLHIPEKKETLVKPDGAYTTTVEIDDRRIAKFSRLLKLDGNKVKVQGGNTQQYLVEHTNDSEADRYEVITKMRELAEEKRKTYETLGKYIGEYLPELEFFAIVESPRREIEKRRNKAFTQDDLADIPTSEISLMEVWERVDTNNSFENKSYTELKKAYEDENIKKEMAGFANALCKLAVEQRIMVDICDFGGIKTVDNNDSVAKKEEYFDIEDLQKNIEKGLLLIPRNTTISDNRLKFFDIYPTVHVEEDISNETIQKIIQGVRENDWNIIDNAVNTQAELHALRYFMLLKYMGAEL